MNCDAYNVLLAVGQHSKPWAAPKISDPRAAHATTHGQPLNNPWADRPSTVGPWVPSIRENTTGAGARNTAGAGTGTQNTTGARRFPSVIAATSFYHDQLAPVVFCLILGTHGPIVLGRRLPEHVFFTLVHNLVPFFSIFYFLHNLVPFFSILH